MSERIRALDDALQIEYATHQALEGMLLTQGNSLNGKHDPTHCFSKSQNDLRSKDTANIERRETPSNSSNDNNNRTNPPLAPNRLNIKKIMELHASAPSNAVAENTDVIPGGGSTTDMINAFGMLSVQDGPYRALHGCFCC